MPGSEYWDRNPEILKMAKNTAIITIESFHAQPGEEPGGLRAETLSISGVVSRSGGRVHLLYREQLGGDSPLTKNHLVFGEGGAELHKRGEVYADLFFREGELLAGTYRTTYGEMKLDIFTSELRTVISDEEPEVEIRYSIRSGGTTVSEVWIRVRAETVEPVV